MKTDRELLGLAAKAAGMDVAWREVVRSRVAEYQIIKHTRHSAFFTNDSKEWNPLTDDGDALRLAVKLRLRHECYNRGQVYIWLGSQLIHNEFALHENNDDERCAATRRAIVRAAAAIGEAL